MATKHRVEQQPKSVEPVDILIVTAADSEDDAVRLVEDGAVSPWEETPGPSGYGFTVWRSRYLATNDGQLTVALTRAYEMGGEGASNAAARLVDAYKPRCLAMCGVCAGNPSRVRLGDVIVADRVWRYDAGEQVNLTPGDKPVFHADTMTFQLNAQWKQAAERFSVPQDAAWLAERPRPRHMQADWVLREILEGRDPLDSPDRSVFCTDWKPVVDDLQEKRLIRLKDGRAELTKAGRERIQQVLFEHAGQLPEPEPWKIPVGPLGTGNDLVKDVDIWDHLQPTQRHVLGLDMEASVIGFTAHVQNVPYMIVIKGVMDYAEPGRNQGFRLFAARAAAEVLLGFLREHLALELPSATAQQQLKPNTADPPTLDNPGTLLNARYQVVPFFEDTRLQELKVLESWCGSAEPSSVRLFVGPGGSGKTRLLIEWANRLRERGWHADFLRDRVTSDDIEALLASQQRTLVVVDYAECRPGLLDLLRRVSSRPEKGLASVRIALLAREKGDWWESLRTLDADVAHLLAHHEPLLLTPVPVEGTLRRRAFDQASEAFAKVRGKAVLQANVEIGDKRFGRMLYLHMAALASVEELPVSADALLEEIVSHEEHFWRRQFEETYSAKLLDRAEFTASARRAVAAVTLLGGVPTKEAAEELNLRVDGSRQEHFCPFLRWLYPGEAEIAAQNVYLSGLEPDLLGETLVARVLSDRNTRQDYLDKVFAGAVETALRNGFIVLARIALREGKQAEAWIKLVLDADVGGRGKSAFEAAMTLGAETAFAPLGVVLADALQREGTTLLARNIEPVIPRETVSLREVALWATQTLLRDLPSHSETEVVLCERARLFNMLGNRLSDLGRREEALEATHEAVGIYRRLAEARPDMFVPDLALGLNNLGSRLAAVGQREQALDATREAVQYYRSLSNAFAPDLAMSLNNLGNRFSELGHYEKALKASNESVGICRRLAEARPDTFLPHLGMSLNNLGSRLDALGRREQALEATYEAVGIRRKLAEARPDAFLPHLVNSLHDLGIRLSKLGRRKKALAANKEAVLISRTLAETRPNAFLPALAIGLNNLGKMHFDVGRPEQGLQAVREAVKHYRTLADARAEIFLLNLVMSLNSLAMTLIVLEQPDEALTLTREAVQHCRTLAETRPNVHLPYLAGSLHNLGTSLTAAGQHEQALAATREAVYIRRTLPDTHLPDLAASLNNLGRIYADTGRRDHALQATREAVTLYGALVQQLPQAHSQDFLRSVRNLARQLQEVERSPEEDLTMQWAIEIIEKLGLDRQPE